MLLFAGPVKYNAIFTRMYMSIAVMFRSDFLDCIWRCIRENTDISQYVARDCAEPGHSDVLLRDILHEIVSRERDLYHVGILRNFALFIVL